MCRLWKRRRKNSDMEKPEIRRKLTIEKRLELRGKHERQLMGDNWRPFHVINMALNIVSSENLSSQERKAEFFTVSSDYRADPTTSRLIDEPANTVA